MGTCVEVDIVSNDSGMPRRQQEFGEGALTRWSVRSDSCARCIKLCATERSHFLLQPIQAIQFSLNRRLSLLFYFPSAEQGLFRNPTHLMKQFSNLCF